jgi:RNA polymerase sigma-70 factor (ECF subfamily)
MDIRVALAQDLDGYFEQLVLCYQNQLYAFALRIAGNPQDAEEIAQDAFVRAYRALAGYTVEQVQTLMLRAWLYQITLNVFRNRVRGKRLKLVPLDELNTNAAEPRGGAQDEPEAIVARAERERELGAVIAKLPERYRVALVLRHVEGFGYGELATLLNQPVGTVKSNVHRGVELLRKALDESVEEVRS